MLHLSRAHLDAIRTHAARDYPFECVGALFGSWDFAGNVRTVAHVLPLRNASANPRREFELDAAERLRVFFAEEKRLGATLIGFYHSHPDCPAVPSETDRRRCGFAYSFVIVPVTAGRAGDVRSWVFDPTREEFAEEELRLEDRGLRREA
jgi:proteasome lid subunit RPN8/RPN11